MKNLLLISTSYRTPDLIQVGFALGQRVKGFSIDRKGTDVRNIQGLLAHQSLKTTEVYTHLNQKSLANSKSPIDIIARAKVNENHIINDLKHKNDITKLSEAGCDILKLVSNCLRYVKSHFMISVNSLLTNYINPSKLINLTQQNQTICTPRLSINNCFKKVFLVYPREINFSRFFLNHDIK